jgi:hypothetical protein
MEYNREREECHPPSHPNPKWDYPPADNMDRSSHCSYKDCPNASKSFGLRWGAHHCLRCGKYFCDMHSAYLTTIKYGKMFNDKKQLAEIHPRARQHTKYRVCGDCFCAVNCIEEPDCKFLQDHVHQHYSLMLKANHSIPQPHPHTIHMANQSRAPSHHYIIPMAVI